MTLPPRRSFAVGGFQSLSPKVRGTRDQGRAPELTEPEVSCRSQLSWRGERLLGVPWLPRGRCTPLPRTGQTLGRCSGALRAPRQGRMRGEPMWRTEAMGKSSRKSQEQLSWGLGWALGRAGSWREERSPRPWEWGRGPRKGWRGPGLRCISGPVCPGPTPSWFLGTDLPSLPFGELVDSFSVAPWALARVTCVHFIVPSFSPLLPSLTFLLPPPLPCSPYPALPPLSCSPPPALLVSALPGGGGSWWRHRCSGGGGQQGQAPRERPVRA